MKNGSWIIALFVLFGLFSASAISQQHGETDHAQKTGPATNEKQPFPRPHWMVKYIAGSLRLKPDQWLKIGFVSRLAPDETVDASIRVQADQLVAVEFNPKTEKESDLLQGPRSGCSYARTMMPDTSKSRPEVLIATTIEPGPLSRLAERLEPKHSVRFVWNEAGLQRSMMVKVDDCEYQSFVANVRWIAGSHWQQIERELK